ncbi:uncharacterized protein [Setaria viridis]|uniref:uncharacterized protein n=1 Tax=Setaria viridis TaxID=4556 RepID=UPI003B3A3EE9
MSDAVSPYATIAVKSHVPMTLELCSSNYSKWSSFFRAMYSKFGLLRHINRTPPNPIDAAWYQANCCVRSWLYGSVSDSVLDFTMTDDLTARQLWVAIETHFQANQAPRAMFMSHEFHSMTQGDLSVEDYGKKMKRAADALRNIGQPVADSMLVLNLLRGANPRYSTTGDFITATPNITFAAALDQLALKELHLANADKVVASTALVASTPSPGYGSNCRSSSAPSGSQPRCKRGSGKRNSDGGQQQPRAPYPTGPWFCFNPSAPQQGGQAGGSGRQGWHGGPSWAGSSGGQGWRGGPGLLGSAPQAHAAFGSPSHSFCSLCCKNKMS